jgi:hypothetical protein
MAVLSCDGYTHNAKAQGLFNSPAQIASAHAHGLPLNHRASRRSREALLLQVPAKEGHVLQVGPEQNVERVANVPTNGGS